MKKLILILAIGVSSASAQTMYKLESPQIYDENGNLYMMRSVYDHVPTSKDSADFLKETKEYIYSLRNITSKDDGGKQYTVEVTEVKYDKEGNLLIRPNGKFKSQWYRCKDKTVKVGDSIMISRKDAVQ